MNRLPIALDWLAADVWPETRIVWVTSSSLCYALASLIISCLTIEPLASVYFESSYIAQCLMAGFFIIAEAVGELFLFRNISNKRYIVASKILMLPLAFLGFFVLLKNEPALKEALHDRPNSTTP